MNRTDIETLLAQEMECIKGGISSGACRCKNGASQQGKPINKCKSATDSKSTTCTCRTGAAQPAHHII
jgi:hypothetical protein